MFKQLSSYILIFFLTFLVGAKDLALGFCLCEEALFLGKDPCENVVNDCGCCEHQCEDEKPCDDCVVKVNLEVEDYLWASDSYNFQAPTAERDKTEPTFSPVRLLPCAQFFPRAFELPPPLGRQLLIQQRRLLL